MKKYKYLLFAIGILLIGSLVFVIANIYSLNLSSPADNTITLDKTPSFTFTVVSNVSTSLSCNLLINNTGYGLNSSTLNNTATTIIANSTLTDGNYNWDINCSDAEGSYASSLYNLTITALGTGTSSDPYQITSWEQLQAMNGVLSSYSILMNDLNSTTAGFDTYASINANGGAGWVPIGTFTGSFDGQGHLISDLYINRAVDYQGLFGYVGSGGVIENTGVNGSVSGSGFYIGGLVGVNKGTITNSYSTGSVSGGNGDVGGLVADNRGTITNSYSTGSVSGGNGLIGGLVGENGGTITDSFWDTQTSGQTTSAGGTGKTTIEMQTLSTFTNWNITSVTQKADGYANHSYIWNIVDGSTYPFESWEYSELLLYFISPTPNDNSYLNHNYLPINISVTGSLDTLTTYLYNSTNLIQTIYNTTAPAFNNFTNLNDGIYYVNDSANLSSGGSNNLTTRTFTIDTIPNINFNSPTNINNSFLNLTTNIPVNISLTETYFKNVTFNFYNTNGTIISYSYTNSTRFINKSFPQGYYFYNITTWTTTNQTNSTSTKYITIDSLPTIKINSPTGTIKSNNVTFNFTINNPIGILSYCYYNVTTSGGASVVVDKVISCSNSSDIQTISDGVSYIVNIFANETTGNINTTSGVFTVDTTVVVSSGGGGGAIVPISSTNWEMLTSDGASSFELNIIPKLSKTKSLRFKNSGASSEKLKLTCKDTLGKMCQYISFEKNNITLPLAKGIYVYDGVTVKLPSNVNLGHYSVALIATDKQGNNAIVSMNVNVKSGFVSDLLVKLTSNIPETNVPYFLILFFTLIFGTFIFSQVMFKKIKGGPVWSFITSLFLAVVIITIL